MAKSEKKVKKRTESSDKPGKHSKHHKTKSGSKHRGEKTVHKVSDDMKEVFIRNSDDTGMSLQDVIKYVNTFKEDEYIPSGGSGS